MTHWQDADDLRDADLSAVPATFFERWSAFADICNSPEREAGTFWNAIDDLWLMGCRVPARPVRGAAVFPAAAVGFSEQAAPISAARSTSAAVFVD